jgi:hypothetical protein
VPVRAYLFSAKGLGELQVNEGRSVRLLVPGPGSVAERWARGGS